MQNLSGVKIVYDGECPFCSRFAELVRLRALYGKVELIDARQRNDPLVQSLRTKFKLDDGFVVIHEGQEYYGDAAMRFLAGASNDKAMMGRLLKRLFPAGGDDVKLYRWMVRGRNAALSLLGRRPMGY